MSILSRILTRAFKLPPAETHDIEVERDLKVPMPDGVVLLADRYCPRGREGLPTILIRTPYGRANLAGELHALPFAERGFQVVIQSCRGTFGSGGAFDPFRNERPDGLATVAWLKAQPWFSGGFATFGASYVGYTQWAIASEAGPELKAIAVQVSSSEFRSPMFIGGSFWLDTALTWLLLVHSQEGSPLTVFLSRLRSTAIVRRAMNTIPLREADQTAIGGPMGFYRDWIDHSAPEDPWWEPVDFRAKVADITAPAHLVAGWYDIFLLQSLLDYERLRAAGRAPHLTIGPWFHMDLGWFAACARESLVWFRAHLAGDPSGLRESPVRVYVMGAGEWKEMAAWPPPEYTAKRWYLQPKAGLSPSAPEASPPDRYRYDPSDPTPAVGGSSLSKNAGAKKNNKLEARSDVLLYTSAPLDRDLEVIGPVNVELFVKSSLEHTDFFARLCDVDPSGRSTNITDGILRIGPGGSAPDEGGVRAIQIELFATACRFKRGHRVRVQISSGAHPRFARNPGTGEPLGAETHLVAAEQAVYHEPGRASAILLPTREHN